LKGLCNLSGEESDLLYDRVITFVTTHSKEQFWGATIPGIKARKTLARAKGNALPFTRAKDRTKKKRKVTFENLLGREVERTTVGGGGAGRWQHLKLGGKNLLKG